MGRPKVEVIQHRQPVRLVQLDCGCTVDADHRSGELKVTCSHGYDHVVKALPPIIQYSSRRLK